MLAPKKIAGELLFGTGKPDATGYLYGVYCVVSHGIMRNIVVTPDFNEKILEGNINISGSITIVRLLIRVIGVVMDKKLRRFVSRLKRA